MADPLEPGMRRSTTATFFEQRLLQDAAREKQKARHTLLMNLKERDLRDRPSSQFLRECREQTVSDQFGAEPEETMGQTFGITDVPKNLHKRLNRRKMIPIRSESCQALRFVGMISLLAVFMSLESSQKMPACSLPFAQ